MSNMVPYEDNLLKAQGQSVFSSSPQNGGIDWTCKMWHIVRSSAKIVMLGSSSIVRKG